MTAVRQMDVAYDFAKYAGLASCGEPVTVSCPDNHNIVLISEADYKAMAKAKRNADYLAKLDRSDQQLKEGRVVIKTMEELEAMAEE